MPLHFPAKNHRPGGAQPVNLTPLKSRLIQPPFGAPKSYGEPISLQFRNSVTDSGNETVYTFSDQPIGTPSFRRLIVIAVVGAGGTPNAVSSVSVGGQAASLVATSTLDTELIADLWSINLSTLDTADVVVTFGGAKDSVGIGVYTICESRLTAWDTVTSKANPATGTLLVPAGGVAIAIAGCRNDPDRTYTWTGLTEDYDEVQETIKGVQSGASGAFTATQSPLTVTATPSGTTSFDAMAGASWAPRI